MDFFFDVMHAGLISSPLLQQFSSLFQDPCSTMYSKHNEESLARMDRPYRNHLLHQTPATEPRHYAPGGCLMQPMFLPTYYLLTYAISVRTS